MPLPTWATLVPAEIQEFIVHPTLTFQRAELAITNAMVIAGDPFDAVAAPGVGKKLVLHSASGEFHYEELYEYEASPSYGVSIALTASDDVVTGPTLDLQNGPDASSVGYMDGSVTYAGTRDQFENKPIVGSFVLQGLTLGDVLNTGRLLIYYSVEDLP